MQAGSITLMFGFYVALCSPVAAAERPYVTNTYVYKKVGDVSIQVDVHRPKENDRRGVVVWLHGGALIVGNRASVPKSLMDFCKEEGFVVVSFDYRLAPEVKAPAIIEDIEDAFRWLHKEGPTLFPMDPNRIVVTGGSAGGYLTLMTGFRITPRPRALVAYWGYGDVDGEWYTKPSEHYRKKIPLIDGDEARKAVGKKVLSETAGEEGKARGRYYHYLRQNGLWTQEVTGFDPVKDKVKLDPLCPIRNVTRDYPPTLLIHGTEDTDVPYELSAAMAKMLERHEVKHEFITVKGAEHGLAGADKGTLEKVHSQVGVFIRSQLRAAK